MVARSRGPPRGYHWLWVSTRAWLIEFFCIFLPEYRMCVSEADCVTNGGACSITRAYNILNFCTYTDTRSTHARMHARTNARVSLLRQSVAEPRQSSFAICSPVHDKFLRKSLRTRVKHARISTLKDSINSNDYLGNSFATRDRPSGKNRNLYYIIYEEKGKAAARYRINSIKIQSLASRSTARHSFVHIYIYIRYITHH